MSYRLPLEYVIYDIIKKKNNLTEDELIEEIKEMYKITKNSSEPPSKKEIYKALMYLELMDKILVINQRDTKIIMLKDHGGRSS